MRIDIVTLFPDLAMAPLSDSIINRAREAGVVEIHAHQLRNWSEDKHRRVDATPYGGGPGMVLRPEPLVGAVESLQSENSKTILMTPQGVQLKQQLVADLSKESHLIVLCGHYEGVDQRVVESVVDLEVSIGDYILTNGAVAAAVLSDAIIRLLPGALGDDDSPMDESFSDPNLLEAPSYTKPSEFRGMEVPEVLKSGNHAHITAWKEQQALQRTKQNRPDLMG